MIRPIQKDEGTTWAALRGRLWPEADAAELRDEAEAFLGGLNVPTIAAVFLAEEKAVPVGFLELAVRPFSDGCESRPVPHVEGWYVEPFARGRGVGSALMEAAETWARQNGFRELASDSDVRNDGSVQAHLRCGFPEMERLVKFRKLLS